MAYEDRIRQNDIFLLYFYYIYMNILTVALTCLLVYYLYQGFRPLKRQKGGGKGVVIAVVLLLLAGGGVAAYFLLKDDSSPSPSPTPSPVGNSGSGHTTPPAYIKYSGTHWGSPAPCVPYSNWNGHKGIRANTDINIQTTDDSYGDADYVICPVPSVSHDGTCTGDCLDDCNDHYGQHTDGKLYRCYSRGRHDQKCVVSRNPIFRVYTDSNCSDPP